MKQLRVLLNTRLRVESVTVNLRRPEMAFVCRKNPNFDNMDLFSCPRRHRNPFCVPVCNHPLIRDKCMKM